MISTIAKNRDSVKRGRALVVTVVTDESLMEVSGGIMEGRATTEDVIQLVGVAGGITEGRAATEDTELSMEVTGGVNMGRATIEDVVPAEPSLK